MELLEKKLKMHGKKSKIKLPENLIFIIKRFLIDL